MQPQNYNSQNNDDYVAPYPSEIVDQVLSSSINSGSLYISGIEGAKNENLLNQLQISSVLTVGSDISYIRFNENIQHKIIMILDYPDQNISQFFNEASNFIYNSLSQKKNILVHCHLGVSRSATLVLAYLVSSCRMGLDESLNYLKSKRPQIKPNEGFMLQLYDYQNNIKKQLRIINSSQPQGNNIKVPGNLPIVINQSGILISRGAQRRSSIPNTSKMDEYRRKQIIVTQRILPVSGRAVNDKPFKPTRYARTPPIFFQA